MSVGGSRNNNVTLPGVVTIPAGDTGTPIIIDPIMDGVTEPIETLGLTLQPSPSGLFPPPYMVSSAIQTSAGVSLRDLPYFPNGHAVTVRSCV